MTKKVLMVLTSSGLEGCGGEGHAGFFLAELAHPYMKFKEAGCDVTICSIKGGACHVAAASLAEDSYDAECKSFWENESLKALTQSTQSLSSYKGTDFHVIFFVGGFGTMSDFPNDAGIQNVSKEVYEAGASGSGGIVAAVCHGQSALFNIKLSNGDYLVKGKTVTSFTNEEEVQAGNIPLPDKSCEDVMKERGATFVGGAAWGCNVQQSERLFTGQNPASAGALAAAIMAGASFRYGSMLPLTSTAAQEENRPIL